MKIAIIGMSCVTEQFRGVREFFNFLFSAQEGDTAALSVMSDMHQHCQKLYGIHESLTDGVDPQIALCLGTAFDALQDAWLLVNQLDQQTGVFIGSSGSDHQLTQVQQAHLSNNIAGLSRCFIANWLSFALNINGPSQVIDTACSSSSAAIIAACDNLRLKRIDLAIAGGVQINGLAKTTEQLRIAGMLSEQGTTQPYSKNSDGYVRSQGCGLVVLKRLEDAQADGDRIYSTINSESLYHNGLSNGLTSPNVAAQQAMYQQALARGSLNPADIRYVEGHGIGSKLGDMVELRGLKEIYGTVNRSEALKIGTLKQGLGNLESASGVMSLIKLALCLHHKKFPETQINEPIGFNDEVIELNVPAFEFEDREYLAALNNFSIGGTNAHIILSNYDSEGEKNPSSHHQVDQLLLSAASEKALSELIDVCIVFVESNDEVEVLNWVDYNNYRNPLHTYRINIAFDSLNELKTKLVTIQQQSSADVFDKIPKQSRVVVHLGNLASFISARKTELKLYFYPIWHAISLQEGMCNVSELVNTTNLHDYCETPVHPIINVLLISHWLRFVIGDDNVQRNFPSAFKTLVALEKSELCSQIVAELESRKKLDKWSRLLSLNDQDENVDFSFDHHQPLRETLGTWYILGLPIRSIRPQQSHPKSLSIPLYPLLSTITNA
ncbi:polyketide synthase [Pseudoalteromonas prydzensis]|uniref:Ketosynthase family 3 (KS3) domain-containing protein n=1 Tax=Pseudoalteromonas prydzensis TaxID=182141 RepID=A0ABR9FSA8_9GAMM|nr:polyketide synthase [Pseudoalteromonas prydzensis]MBE0459706.1 hypothetical protein [Pseudoalteromonas prydzensis]